MMVFEKGTLSFSLLIIPFTCWSSVNMRLPIPSKHFFRWGCTRRGSLVSDKISNSSSLERKKNLWIFGIMRSRTIQKTTNLGK